ncbi:hypothetical protein QN382_19135 [Pseudomonas sp. 10B1]|uniref:hypothetical protein n=1 Tax=unclassified Pseudomonas TaxID=196821 RepID=UPI002B221E15|nr:MULTISPECIES: hypothetical protein [unclassified Pseudomonas]MEA9994307.1 hypothetical protein [Pseudomonas sp. AA4]MEB0088516.1 hypothetical protein [Pseudomonas sp. RTI1]MEB0126561.1 hypothetical protein [Pseudomonas sp. CCC1.2]MEB0154626.1 hypothetical protein [Pseudomonas sp. CCC4.3]MEB0220771.1 hypothetical protein [Pseudomonas sp. AB12(2023)]
MQDFIRKSFGGLSTSYYLRHFVFGAVLLVLMVWLSIQSKAPVKVSFLVFSVLSTILYPYSRFVYERIVGFVMGENVFFVNAILMLMVKSITMLLCWFLAVFIAPIGLAYLYFAHSKADRN